MSKKQEIKPRLFEVSAGSAHWENWYVIAYTANDALQIVLDQHKHYKDYAAHIKHVKCLNVTNEWESEIVIAPECLQTGGLKNIIKDE